MKTREKIEKKGYKIIRCMSGKLIAQKDKAFSYQSERLMADNITQLYRLISAKS